MIKELIKQWLVQHLENSTTLEVKKENIFLKEEKDKKSYQLSLTIQGVEFKEEINTELSMLEIDAKLKKLVQTINQKLG